MPPTGTALITSANHCWPAKTKDLLKTYTYEAKIPAGMATFLP